MTASSLCKKRKGEKKYFSGMVILLYFLMLLFLMLPDALAQKTNEVENTLSTPTVATAVSVEAEEQQTVKKQKNKIITTYNQNRLAFETRKKNITAEILQEGARLKGEIRKLEQELESGSDYLNSNTRFGRPQIPDELTGKLARIRSKRNSAQDKLSFFEKINSVSANVLVPLSLFVSILGSHYTENIFFIVLPITILNLTLFLYFQNKGTFILHKKWLIILIVAVLVASATSLLAAPVDKRLEVEDKLRYAENMLELTGNQKAIIILEKKKNKSFILPSGLSSGDPLLKIYPRFAVNSPEYYFTLAALYTAEHQNSKAIEALSTIAEKKNLTGGAPSQEIILATIRYLIENGYPDMAGTCVTNHAEWIYGTNALLELTEYLKSKAMQVSSDYVMKLVEKKTKTTDNLLILAKFYRDAGKADKGLVFLDRALQKATNIHDIILVAEACESVGAAEIFKKIPSRLQKVRGKISELNRLADLFSKHGESAQAEKILERAIREAENVQQLKVITSVVNKLQQGQLMAKISDKVISLNYYHRVAFSDKKFQAAYFSSLDFIDFLITLKRKQDAVQLFEALSSKIKEGRTVDRQFIDQFLALSKAALQRDMKKQAADIARMLTLKIKPRPKAAFYTYFKLDDSNLVPGAELPNKESISIPLYQGLINEEINKLSVSEKLYSQSVIFALDALNNSYGEKLPSTLNDFYLLGRLWQKVNQVDALATLDRVYTLLENHLLVLLKEEERQRVLKEPLARLAVLKVSRQKQVEKIQERESYLESRKADIERARQELIAETKQSINQERFSLNQLNTKVLLKGMATTILQIIFIGLMVGCIILSWKYSQRLREHKTYGFLTRFVELNGWLRVFSVLGFLTGLGLVVISQLLQMIQKIHELTLQRLPHADYLVATGQHKDAPGLEINSPPPVKETRSEKKA